MWPVAQSGMLPTQTVTPSAVGRQMLWPSGEQVEAHGLVEEPWVQAPLPVQVPAWQTRPVPQLVPSFVGSASVPQTPLVQVVRWHGRTWH